VDYDRVFAIVFGIALAEMLLSGTWARWYFRLGIPIFRREYESRAYAGELPTAEALAEPLANSVFPAIVFRSFGDGLYGFRERAWPPSFRLSYTPIMRGIVRFDGTSSRVVVLGMANWFPLAFAYLWLSFVGSDSGFALFFVALLGAIYAIQAARFRNVGMAAAEAWACVSAGESGGAS
jgi:hypothetical protein